MLSNDPKKFWRVINPSSEQTITLINGSGDAIAPEQCASSLNISFTGNFCRTINVPLPPKICYNYPIMFPIMIDSVGVENIIKSLKLSSAPGCDLITTKFLKGTCAYSSIILTKIFQQSLHEGVLPIEWKIGKIVPFHKSGDKHSPLNYRPISLTSIPCKILEHILYSNLATFLESNSFFTRHQHGFRKTFSCETQLVAFTHKLNVILDQTSSADCIFIDFSKAFDKVCHNLLLHKLNELNIDPRLLTWLECFLKNRSQFVSVNNVSSEPSAVHSGVPQGSVLGPLLFLIYINDLPSCITSNIHLFADDCVIFREITCDGDITSLQHDLNSISLWCKTWLMELNNKKCQFLRVSRANHQLPNYYLDNTPLQSVTNYKYLGVHITTDLTWTVHCNYVIKNANRMLGYLRRNFSTAPSFLKLLLYTTLIRPKLEYSAAVWDPSHANLIHSLEMVQNNSIRFILSNYNRTASITAMKSSLNLPSLSSRRKMFRLHLFHKLFHHTSLRDGLILPPSYISPRLDHSHKVGLPSCRTRAFSQSFIPRTSEDWNRLPASAATIVNHLHFKSVLASYV